MLKFMDQANNKLIAAVILIGKQTRFLLHN